MEKSVYGVNNMRIFNHDEQSTLDYYLPTNCLLNLTREFV